MHRWVWLALMAGCWSAPTLQVTVLDVDGHPVKGSRVMARSTDLAIRMECKVFEANTNAEGVAIFDHFCPESGYLIQAPAGPGVEVRGSVDVGATNLTLRPPASASGATDAAFGEVKPERPVAHP